MRLAKEQLKRIIKEEIATILEQATRPIAEDDATEPFGGPAMVAATALTGLGELEEQDGPPGAIPPGSQSGDVEGAYTKSPFMNVKKMRLVIKKRPKVKKEQVEAVMSEEGKPSAGLSKKKKSDVVKKARKGGDIGKKGKEFDKVAAKAAKKYGSKEAGERVAAAAMWKNIKR